VATRSQPFVMVQGFGQCNSRYSTTVAVTIPQVASVLVDGQRRVDPVPLPGLPYGLRGARIVTANESCTSSGRLAHHQTGPTLIALDSQGHPIPQQDTRVPVQATVHSWHSPGIPPHGSCGLQATGLSGLSVNGGEVADAIRPFRGGLIGHAFLPCIETIYHLHGMPLRAMVVLDAADPHVRPAPIPGFKPVRGSAGFFAEGGTLTARRSGNAWLIVGQGRNLAQRISLLSHLKDTIKL